VLGNIGFGRSYQDLIADSIKRPLGEIAVDVLGLEALIRAKIEAGRDKDRAVLPILQRTLEESSK
jgi:hypothetical protein